MPDPDPFWWRDEAPAKPRKVEGGIQINSTRGPVARTWWSLRFLSVLEQLGVGGRLSRGRTYARAGQIVSLDVDAGGAVAQVQGSRPQPYKVRIGIPAFGKAEWALVTQALAGQAVYAAALLNGEMPREIEQVFDEVGLSLFPAGQRDLAMDSARPGPAVPDRRAWGERQRPAAPGLPGAGRRGRTRLRRSRGPPPSCGQQAEPAREPCPSGHASYVTTRPCNVVDG
jgi:hypothetical protein